MRLDRAGGLIARAAAAGRIYLFLDFDGTLAPIAKTPQSARMPAATRSLVRRLAALKKVTVAIISGREIRDLKKMAGLRGIIYAGNHGMQYSGRGLSGTVNVGMQARKAASRALTSIRKNTAAIRGVKIEDKFPLASVHYRLAGAKSRKAVKRAVYTALRPFAGKKILKVREGKMHFEVMPYFSPTKGDAVKKLAGKAEGALAIFAGDDATDRDAFRALGRNDARIFVGNRIKLPREANYYARDTKELARFLKALLLALTRAGQA